MSERSAKKSNLLIRGDTRSSKRFLTLSGKMFEVVLAKLEVVNVLTLILFLRFFNVCASPNLFPFNAWTIFISKYSFTKDKYSSEISEVRAVLISSILSTSTF